MSGGIRTPDGATLLDGMCLCASHCANRCEPACCPPGTRWCRCWCHSDRYLTMQEGPAEGDMRVSGNAIQEYYRGEWIATVTLKTEEQARKVYAVMTEDMRAGRLEV